VVKLKIDDTVTPITIFNATVLRIAYEEGAPQTVGLHTLLNTTTLLGTYPAKPRITSPAKVNFTKTVSGNLYGGYKVCFLIDLRIEFRDAVGRPLSDVKAIAIYKDPAKGIGWTIPVNVTGSTGVLKKVPLTPGTSYSVEAKWRSKYDREANTTATVKDLYSVITMPVYDVTLILLSKRGMPLVGIPVEVKGVKLGVTDAYGAVTASQIPAGTYDVSAEWLGTALNLPSLVVSASVPITLTPTNVHTLTIRVTDAQGQALEGATVRVKKSTIEITKLTDRDGMAEIELPDANYVIEVSYGEVSERDSASLTTDVTKTFTMNEFIEIFGIGMTIMQFTMMIAIIVILLLVWIVGVSRIVAARKRKVAEVGKTMEEIRKYERYLERLEELRKEGRVSREVYDKLKADYESKIEMLKKGKAKPT
jgi:hypothetical protein